MVLTKEKPVTVPDRIVVSYSQLQTWRQCRRKWYFHYAQQLQSKETGPAYALLLGLAVHEALDAYYDPKTKRDPRRLINTFHTTIEQQREEVEANYSHDPDILSQFEGNVNLGYAMVENYGQTAPDLDNFTVLQTEHEFDLPLGFEVPVWDDDSGKHVMVPVYYRGRIDGIIQTEDDHILLFEHKTAKQFQEKRLILDQQATSYIWAAQQLFDLPVEGVLYNILRKQMPGPRVKAPLVYRLEALRSFAHIDSFPATVKEIVTDMSLAAEHSLYFHNPTDYCSWCPFLQVCSMIQDAADPTEYIEEYFEVTSGNDKEATESELESVTL